MVFGLTRIPPAYFILARVINIPKGILKFKITLLIIELWSIIFEKESLRAGTAIQRSPDSVSFTLSGYPRILSVIIVVFPLFYELSSSFDSLLLLV